MANRRPRGRPGARPCIRFRVSQHLHRCPSVDPKLGQHSAPKIKLLAVKDSRSPYPLTQEEQSLLFQELPDYLARMALYKVNTGCRKQEVCRLHWRL
jgi:integrase